MIKPSLTLPVLFVAMLGLGAYQTWQPEETADRLLRQGASLETLSLGSPPNEVGSWPTEWIYGGDCANDPKVQIHKYSDNVFVLRQSKCEIFEAPFMYMIFGDDTVLLMDTGANNNTPIYEPVSRVIRFWLGQNGKTSIDLIVANTHHHFDHVQGNGQFPGKPFVSQVVPANLAGMVNFFGFVDYPNDQTSIDLGGRVVDVIGVPGHHPASVALYDRETQILFSGDIVYPGHLFVFSAPDWQVFLTSIRRMITFAANNPVKWVVGCHVEMSDTPFVSYAYGTQVQPDEHPLEFSPSILLDIYAAALGQGNMPACEKFAEFVLHPVYLCGITWNG